MQNREFNLNPTPALAFIAIIVLLAVGDHFNVFPVSYSLLVVMMLGGLYGSDLIKKKLSPKTATNKFQSL